MVVSPAWFLIGKLYPHEPMPLGKMMLWAGAHLAISDVEAEAFVTPIISDDEIFFKGSFKNPFVENIQFVRF